MGFCPSGVLSVPLVYCIAKQDNTYALVFGQGPKTIFVQTNNVQINREFVKEKIFFKIIACLQPGSKKALLKLDPYGFHFFFIRGLIRK